MRNVVTEQNKQQSISLESLGWPRRIQRATEVRRDRYACWDFIPVRRIWAESHEECFRQLTGVTRVVVLDNLREGVL